ncbi:MAG TPA: hypothetical protein VKP69_09455, partial [Isosphaeraceae bacterium]|nr:hypothetical protein [Isosphaeraceae bacterium]
MAIEENPDRLQEVRISAGHSLTEIRNCLTNLMTMGGPLSSAEWEIVVLLSVSARNLDQVREKIHARRSDEKIGRSPQQGQWQFKPEPRLSQGRGGIRIA